MLRPNKIALAVMISMFAGVPLIVFLVLSETGSLGNFSETGLYRSLKYILIGATLLFYFVVSPFFLWPRIFSGDDGKAVRARIISIEEKKSPEKIYYPDAYSYAQLVLEIKNGSNSRVVTHRELILNSRLEKLEVGMEIDVKISHGGTAVSLT